MYQFDALKTKWIVNYSFKKRHCFIKEIYTCIITISYNLYKNVSQASIVGTIHDVFAGGKVKSKVVTILFLIIS